MDGILFSSFVSQGPGETIRDKDSVLHALYRLNVMIFNTKCNILNVANEETVEIYLYLSYTLSLCYIKYRLF
jgi:hypothetical protein